MIPDPVPCLTETITDDAPLTIVSFSLYNASEDTHSLCLDDDLLVFNPPAASTPTKTTSARPLRPPAVPVSSFQSTATVSPSTDHKNYADIHHVKVGPIYAVDKKSKAMMIGPIEYSNYIRDLWPHPTSTANRAQPIHMNLYQRVRSTNLPNYMSAQVQIPSDINCDAWDMLLTDYPDRELCKFLRYGWPSNYTAPTPPTSTLKNHPSALAHQDEVDKFVQKELSKGALLGPFDKPPFSPWTQVSPLMTAEKKDSLRRRVIIDLSFPNGLSVNDGVARNFFQGYQTSYSLPTVHDLAKRIIELGPGTLLWKTDLLTVS